MVDETVSFTLQLNVEDTDKQLQKLQATLYRTLDLAQKLGMPADLSQAISIIQRQISALNELRLAILAVQAARLAAGDPVAWAFAAVSVVGATVSLAESTGSFG